MTRQVTLSVNDIPIEIDYFVQGFIDHTVGSMVLSLEHAGEIKTMNVVIEGERVILSLNDAEVPINPFVTKIIRNTVTGMVSSLKGVGEINKINISVRR